MPAYCVPGVGTSPCWTPRRPPAAHSTALPLPGYTGSKEDFIALLEPLADAGFRVLSVDGRGQYETEGANRQNPYAQAELARDVLAQAAAVDEVPRPAASICSGTPSAARSPARRCCWTPRPSAR